jgi:ribosomal protein S18 acetylase RimI-like enzyme
MYLAAVKENPVYFGKNYEESVKKFDFEWKQECQTIKTLEKGIHDMVFCASHEGKEIGVLAFRTWKMPHESFGGIGTLYVIPAYRRHGIAKKLINTLIIQAQEWQLHHLKCEVHHTNKTALLLWDSCGFKTTGILDRQYWITQLLLP